MAEGFHVSGPTKVQVCLLGDNALFEDLGHTDNTDLVNFEEDDHFVGHTSNETGEMIAEVVYNGTTGTLRMTLQKWDETILAKLKTRMRQGVTTGSNEGFYAQVGKCLVADSRFFGIKILTTRTGELSYVLKKCWMPVPSRKADFGNIGQKLLLVFQTLPDTSTGAFYVATAN